MFSKAMRMALVLGAATQLLFLVSPGGEAQAQRHDHRYHDGKRDRDWQRDRDHRDHGSRDSWQHREREREQARERKRRDEAKATGVVIGLVGTAVLAGVIANAASRKKEQRERADYCINRYGNYNAVDDTYRAPDGYTYRCR